MTKTPQVSSHGAFKSVYGVMTRPRPTKAGYCVVGIEGKNYLVHRLVAKAWEDELVAQIPGQVTINHKDGNKSNNHYTNLEWASHVEQRVHAQLIPGRRSSAMARSKPVMGRKIGDAAWVRTLLSSTRHAP